MISSTSSAVTTAAASGPVLSMILSAITPWTPRPVVRKWSTSVRLP